MDALSIARQLRKIVFACADRPSPVTDLIKNAADQIDDLRLSTPKPVYITREEGGNFLPFPENRGGQIHSIHFSDGTVFDAYNGWRPE